MITFVEFMTLPVLLIKLVGMTYGAKKYAAEEGIQFIWLFYFNMLNLAGNICCMVLFLFSDAIKTQLEFYSNIIPITTLLCGMVKCMTMWHGRRTMFELVNEMRILFPKIPEDHATFNTEHHLKELNAWTKKFVTLIIFSTVLFEIVPIGTSCWKYMTTDTGFEYRFPYGSILNNYVRSGWSYSLMYLYQMYTSLCGVTCIVAIDVGSTYFGKQICMHFEYLKKELQTLDYRREGNRIFSIIRHHQTMIRIAETTNDIYSFSNLVNFFLSVILVCLTGFVIMVEHDLYTQVLFPPMLLAALSEAFVTCQAGQGLMDSSSSVGDGVYHGSWLEASIAHKKNLVLIIMRAQKPCVYTLAGYAVVNHHLFTNLLSNSHQIYTLLRAVYKRD